VVPDQRLNELHPGASEFNPAERIGILLIASPAYSNRRS